MTTVRYCVQCGDPLPERSRIDRRFCKDACRQAAYEDRQRAARVQLIANEHVDDPDERLRQLRDAVAQAVEEPRLLAVVAGAARTQWRAAAWILSRTHPERWGERGRDTPLVFDSDDDPFLEVDQVAQRRAERGAKRQEGY